MRFKDDLEKAVHKCQPKIEDLMKVKLGEVDVKPHSLLTMYNTRRTYELCVALGQNGIISAMRSTLLGAITVRSASAYVDIDESMIIYAKYSLSENKLRRKLTPDMYNARLNLIAYHELAHLAHKKIIGSNLYCYWPSIDTENIANYVAHRAMSDTEWSNLHSLTKSKVLKQIEGLWFMHNRYNDNIVAYINENANIWREDLKNNYPQLNSIKF